MIRHEFGRPDGVRWSPVHPTGDGVLVLAGSSGRIDEDRARVFAERGCVAESIRWFGGIGQHSGPWDIPLETFLDRVDRLGAECDHVWVVGTSFGSEAALLCAAHSDRVAGVVAFAPSDVVWAGYDDQHRETSHWTLDDERLPYLPFDWDGYIEENPARLRPLYERSRLTHAARIPAAAIPVERVSRLLLVAGGDDQVWPSVLHAERIVSRRRAAGRETHLVTEPLAGHRTVLPGEGVVTAGAALLRGGNDDADRRLGDQALAAAVGLLSSVH